MDNCHARDQCAAGAAGHGKSFFLGEEVSLRQSSRPKRKNPQKEKVERYAASFRKLADSFYGLPYRKDYLSNGQVDGIIRETCDEICSHCYQRESLLGHPVAGNSTEEASG